MNFCGDLGWGDDGGRLFAREAGGFYLEILLLRVDCG
jgi:hypothetical protein